MEIEEKINQIQQRVDKGSSPSQKQRNVLYEMWQALKDKDIELENIPNFEVFYSKYMTWNLEFLMSKIEFILENSSEDIEDAFIAAIM